MLQVTTTITGLAAMKAAIEQAQETMSQIANSPASFINIAKAVSYAVLPISVPADERQTDNQLIRNYFLKRNYVPLPTDEECESLIETIQAANMAGLRASLSELIDGLFMAEAKNNLAAYWSGLLDESPAHEESV